MCDERCLYIEEGKVVCPVSAEVVGLERCSACPDLVRIEEPPGGPVVYCSPAAERLAPEFRKAATAPRY